MNISQFQYISSAANNKLVADVSGASSDPGTNVIAFTIKPPTKNQLWQLIRANNLNNQFAIQSALGDVYAAVETDSPGAEVKTSSDNPTTWEVIPVREGSPEVWIKLPDTDLVWTIPVGETKIIIIPSTGLPIPEQSWILKNA